MNVIEFRPVGGSVVVIIDGVDLTVAHGGIGLELGTVEGGHWFGRSDPDWVVSEGDYCDADGELISRHRLTVIQNCSCGDRGCGALITNIEHRNGSIRWAPIWIGLGHLVDATGYEFRPDQYRASLNAARRELTHG